MDCIEMASDLKLLWHKNNWIKINRFVFNIQKELVVAYKMGNLPKVRKLQYQLIMSYQARILAVRKVTSGNGRNTPGVDKIIWNNPKLKFEAISILRKKTQHFKKYKPNLIKRIRIPKQDSDKLRPLGIPTMIDRALQTLSSIISWSNRWRNER